MRKLLLLAMLAVFSASVAAIGVVPGSEDIIYSPGFFSRQLKIMNNEDREFTAVISVEGELKDHIALSKSVIEFSPGKPYEIISYTVNLPQNMSRRGLLKSAVIIAQLPQQKEGSTQIQATLSVVSVVNVIVPYTGKYAEATLFVSDYEEGRESSFAVEVKNLGEEDILKAKAIIDIYTPLNEKVATLESESVAIDTKKSKVLAIKWTPDLPAGRYKAAATVIYDNNNAYDQDEFLIGSPKVVLQSISTQSFRLGGIAGFDLLLESYWNQGIEDVFADISIYNKDRIFSQTKTSSIFMPPYGRQELTAYWDTNGVDAGEYQMDIDLHYLDKKDSYTETVYVSLDEIQTKGTGFASTKTQGEKMPTSIIFIGAVVAILVILNLVLLRRVIKK